MNKSIIRQVHLKDNYKYYLYINIFYFVKIVLRIDSGDRSYLYKSI